MAVDRQQGLGPDRCGGSHLRAGLRRHRVEDRLQRGILGTRLDEHAEHGEAAGSRLVHEVAFHVEALARQQMRSEEHTSELQSLMRISYAVFCLKKKNVGRLLRIFADRPACTLLWKSAPNSAVQNILVHDCTHIPKLK